MGKKIVVSACLMGRNCKYNGGNNYNKQLAEMLKDKEVIEKAVPNGSTKKKR